MEVSSVALFSYLLDDLYGMDRVGFPHDSLYPGASPDAAVRFFLAKSLLKKLSDEICSEADDRCLEKFLAANLRSKEWRLNCAGSWDEQLVGEFLREVDNFFFPEGEQLVSSYFELLSSGRAGPGASLFANGEDFFTKFFSSKLSTSSSELYDTYNEFCGWFPDWRDAEISRALSHGTYRLTSNSRVTFVRKTRDISRLICTEPSLNMFYQLGFGNILERRLKDAFGIDFALQQERNRSLACRGSIDGSVATLDLESASDSVSLNLCSWCLPEYVFDILCRLRVPETEVRGRKVTLSMMSTMGNGFTFPLQTILFCCVVRAAARESGDALGRADESLPSWGVFGDDIICPTQIVGRVIRLLELLGFRVNSEKSFSEGPFRESCGGDFYMGVPVRGVYLKSLRTVQSRYVAINLLNDWSARTGIPLPRSVGYLVDSVPVLAIPAHEQPDSGIRVPPSLIMGRFWQATKQRYLYRCFETVKTVLTFDEAGNVSTPRVRGKRIKRRSSNPLGALLSFLGGYIRNNQVVLPLKQGEDPVYRTRWKVSPFWGPSAEQLQSHCGWDFWKRWNTAVETNLGDRKSVV